MTEVSLGLRRSWVPMSGCRIRLTTAVVQPPEAVNGLAKVNAFLFETFHRKLSFEVASVPPLSNPVAMKFPKAVAQAVLAAVVNPPDSTTDSLIGEKDHRP